MSLMSFIVEYGEQLLVDKDFCLATTIPNTISKLNKERYGKYRVLGVPLKYLDSSVKFTPDKFQLNLDIHHFKPNEISVNIINGFIVIKAKHEEKRDGHGYISRQFTRTYPLPDYCDPETVAVKLFLDGVLSITAPKVPTTNIERDVHITQTGPVKTKKQPKHQKKPLKKK